MNEISELLEQRFGLSAEQAQEAETAILDLVKSKVPPQFQGILNTILGGNQNASQSESGASAPSSEVSGLLGAAESLLGMQRS
jgi:hypothetical protein